MTPEDMYGEDKEIIKEMTQRGIVHPSDLTEYDQWVNEATRKDINNLITKNVFGLKVWEKKIIESSDLKDIYNFGVDYIFKEDKRKRVMQLIKEHNKGKISDIQYLHRISRLAMYSCLWV